jgi:protein-serine/threonine kinase
MTDHDHGLGVSGLRRIRQQHNPMRAPTLPSSSSRTPSLGTLTRSSSLSIMLDAHSQSIPLSPGPSSPAYTEDLSRFPSESLHSFSFAHQSEDLIHNRQTVLKRSLEFMKDRMGWSVASNAAMASAQARVTGDVETQNMLELLAKAQLVGAGNIPNGDPSLVTGPLSGPAALSDENVFEKGFAPRTASPDPIDRTPLVSPTNSGPVFGDTHSAQLNAPLSASSPPSQPSLGERVADSESSTRTPTNESGTTAQTSPPPSRRPSALKRTMTDTAPVSVQQKLLDAMAQPFLAAEPSQPEPRSAPFPPAFNQPSAVSSGVHGHHPARWVPAAQAIFTTQSKPPWTILAANDLACLLFGVTKAEVRKMGIMEVIQEERRAWLVSKLQKGIHDDVGDGSESEVSQQPVPAPQSPSVRGVRAGGITAKLLSKPNSRSQTPKNGRRPATVHSGDPKPPKPEQAHHASNKSRGVLLCGDVVPIQVSPISRLDRMKIMWLNDRG